VQITLTTPLRRMILQFLHIFFTDALTFMSVLQNIAAYPPQVAPGDP